MKRIIQLILMGILNVAIFISCEKDQEPLPELTVSATQTTVDYGATVTLTWLASNATSCTTDAGIISGTSGSIITKPLTETTTFTFIAVGPGGTVSDTIIINVNVIATFKVWASPDSIPYAGTTNLYWETNNVASAKVNNIAIPINGSKLFEGITKDTTFTFKFISSDKKTETDTTITVKVATPIIVVPTIDIIHIMYWMFIKNTSLDEKKTEWETFYFDEDVRSRKWFLRVDHSYTKIKENGTPAGSGFYTIKKGVRDTLILDDTEKMLLSIKISSDTLMQLSNIDSTSINTYKGYLIK